MKRQQQQSQSTRDGLKTSTVADKSRVLPVGADKSLLEILPSSLKVQASSSCEVDLCNQCLTLDDLLDYARRSNDERRFMIGDNEIVPAADFSDATYLAIVAIPRLIKFIVSNIVLSIRHFSNYGPGQNLLQRDCLKKFAKNEIDLANIDG